MVGWRGGCVVILLTVPVAGNKLILRSVVAPKGVACRSLARSGLGYRGSTRVVRGIFVRGMKRM